MSQRFETPKQRVARRNRNRSVAAEQAIPGVVPTLSDRAAKRIACTTVKRVAETHADGELHVVTRGRFDMGYHDRSRYAP